ncbi:MAG: putative ribosomal protein S21 [Prokaryotic dsDNA virus sp.]|nr:MAG: putative ribosomal protein S21 [Prokaryotic dsDNA virus sp.]
MAVNFSIKVRKGVPIQKALKKFKNKYQEYGIREELMNRREYTKPTTKRRKEKMDAIRNYKRQEQAKKELDG